MKKWIHTHHHQGLPAHSLHPSQLFLPAPLKARMLFRMWQVSSPNPHSGHCPVTPEGVWCPPLLGPPKGRAVKQHISPESPLHSAFCCCSSRKLFLCWLLVVVTNRYYQEYLYLCENRHSPKPNMTEGKCLHIWL